MSSKDRKGGVFMKTSYLRKYFIMGSQNCSGDPINILRKALEAGITAFQFREKGHHALSGKEKLELGKKLRNLCTEYNVPFFINDDVHLAKALDVDGIHIGQDDEPIESVREKFPDKWIGLSISNEKELAKSPIHLVDYVGAGPVFQTKTKENVKDPVGLSWIKHLRKHYPELTIVGIGGIHEQNAKQVIDAGANGVAVISAITNSDNIEQTVAYL